MAGIFETQPEFRGQARIGIAGGRDGAVDVQPTNATKPPNPRETQASGGDLGDFFERQGKTVLKSVAQSGAKYLSGRIQDGIKGGADPAGVGNNQQTPAKARTEQLQDAALPQRDVTPAEMGGDGINLERAWIIGGAIVAGLALMAILSE
jgi:hypothetical protein